MPPRRLSVRVSGLTPEGPDELYLFSRTADEPLLLGFKEFTPNTFSPHILPLKMLPEDQPVEYIPEGIDAEMGSQPKVILFDIGGVVVSHDSYDPDSNFECFHCFTPSLAF